MQSARKSSVESFFKQQCDLYRQLVSQYELISKQEVKSSPELTDVNILIVGPRKSGKTALIKYKQFLYSTLTYALHNKFDLEPQQQPSKSIISKTELRKRKRYVVEGRSNLYQPRRAISLLEFSEHIELGTLSKFSNLFGLIDDTSFALCGYKLFKLPFKAHVQSIILCLQIGHVLNPSENQCITYLLSDIRERGFVPLVTLTHTDEFTKGLSQEAAMQKLQKEILKVSTDLSIIRENIYPIQLYTSSVKSTMTQQINYYALTLLTAALKARTQYTRVKQLEKSSRSGLFCGCNW